MGWFNYYGLAIMAVIMFPNVIFAVKYKDGFKNKQQSKALEIFEQVGRYACFVFMVFNIPYTYFGFYFNCAFTVYLVINGVLCLGYLIFWVVFGRGNGRVRAVSLSVTPSLVFLFSGVVLANVPLIVFAVVFAVCHIWLSLKNAAD